MTKQELIKLIVDDLTVSGSLKLSLNEDEISRIIDVEKNMAYRDWRDAVELKIAVMSPAAFRTEEFKKSRTIQMPDCVWGIHEFREIKDGQRLFGIADPDLNMDRIMASDLWLSPFDSTTITTRSISYSWYDLARSFTLIDLSFRFNINTHRLFIYGHEPKAPVYIRAYVGIEESALYDDYYFQRWCIAKSKQQIHRVLKTFEYTTIGGVNITSMYGEQGDKEIQEIKEYIKGQDQADWFLMFQ